MTDRPTQLQIVASGIYHEACDNADDRECVSMDLVDDDTAQIISYNSTATIKLGDRLPDFTNVREIHVDIVYTDDGGLPVNDCSFTIHRMDGQDICQMVADLLYGS